jgi:hypothetical protein
VNYPILVDRWDDKHPADLAVCERCHATFKWDPADGDPYDLCQTHGNPTVKNDCGGQIVMKYDAAPKCGGCGRLGYWDKALAYCCSRRCQLQAEYAETLRMTA